jgi:manganese transport protein
MEAFIITLVLVIGVSFIEMIFAQPEMDKVLIGLIPTMPNQAAYTSP